MDRNRARGSVRLLAFHLWGAAAGAYGLVFGRLLRASFGVESGLLAAVGVAILAGVAFGGIAGRRHHWIARWAPWLLAAYALLLAVLLRMVAAVGGPWGGWGERPESALLALVLFPLGYGWGAGLHRFAPAGGRDRFGHPGIVCGVGLLGGAVGCLLALALLPRHGSTATLAAPIALFLLAGWVAAGGRREEMPAPAGGASGLGGKASLPALALFLLGAALSLHLVSSIRLLDLIIGPTMRAFALSLSIYLAGLGLGAVAWGRLASGLRLSSTFLVSLFTAVVGTLVLTLHGELPYLFVRLVRGRTGELESTLFAKSTIAALITFPGAMLFGILLATLLTAATNRSSNRGRGMGAGSGLFALGMLVVIAMAPALFPAIGIRGILLGSLLTTLLLGMFLLFCEKIFSGPVRILSASALIVFFAALLVNSPRWKTGLLNTGVYRYAGLYEKIGEKEFVARYALLPSFYREGSNATVMAVGVPGNRQLRTNGTVEASDYELLPLHTLLARLPLLFRPGTKDAVVLGLGTGVTVGALLRPSLERIRVAEVERSRVEASRHFSRLNEKYWEDSRVEIVHADPRRDLRSENRSYDLIAGQPFDYWAWSTAHLGTREFFRLAASRLNEGGILSYWVPLIGVSEANLKSLLRSFRDSFSFVLGFRATRHDGLVLLGSDAPMKLELDDVLELWRDPLYPGAFKNVGIQKLPELLTYARFDESVIDQFAGDAPWNSDDRSNVEFGMEPLLFEMAGRNLDRILLSLHYDTDRFVVYDSVSENDRAWFDHEVARAFRRQGYLPGGLRFAERSYRLKPSSRSALTYAHYLKTEMEDLLAAIDVVHEAWEKDPLDPELVRGLADDYYEAGQYRECEEFLVQAVDRGLRESWCFVIQGKALLAQEKNREALDALFTGKEIDRLQDSKGTINYLIGLAYKKLGDLEQSSDFFGRTINRNPRHVYARYYYGENKLLSGRTDRETFEKEYLLPFNRARAESVYARAEKRFFEPQCRAEVEKDLAIVLNSTPNHLGAYLLLAEFYSRHGKIERERRLLQRMLRQCGGTGEVVRTARAYLYRTGGRKKVAANKDLLG